MTELNLGSSDQNRIEGGARRYDNEEETINTLFEGHVKISNLERECQMQWFGFSAAKHVATTAARGTFVELIYVSELWSVSLVKCRYL